MLRKAEVNGQEVAKQSGVSTAILVDLLRRSGALDEAANVVAQASDSISGDVLSRVVNYQEKLIKAGDLDRHTIAEALGDGGHTQNDDTDSARRHQASAKRWWQFWRRHGENRGSVRN